MMFGHHGRYLRIDAGTGSAVNEPIHEDILRSFVGGVGLAAWLLHRECPRGVDPLAPENALAFVFSPLVGTPLTTSAKFAVAAKSPLTDRFCDALSSSRFAIEGKKAGFDALVIAASAYGGATLIVLGARMLLPIASEPTALSAIPAIIAIVLAILGYIGRHYGLLPKDDWEAMRLESLLSACEDLRYAVNRTTGIKDPEEVKRKRAELVEGPVLTWGANMERQITGPFAGGNELSVADIKIYMIVNWFRSGVLDHVPTDVFSKFEKLEGVWENVKKHPKIVEWYARPAPA